MNPSRATGVGLLAVLFSTLFAFNQCGTDNRLDADTASDAGRGGATAAARTPPLGQDPKPTTSAPAVAALAPPPDALRILLSGAMLGHLEPCGCASGQLGGLARRMQHIGERPVYDLLLEGGDLIASNSELDVLKLFTVGTVLFQMQHAYDALGVGIGDLSVPRDEWNALLGAVNAPVIATNLSSSEDGWLGQPVLDKTARTMQVRVGSLLLDELPESLRGEQSQLQRTEPTAAWHEAFADCDAAVLRIVMLHGNEAAIRNIVPQLDPAPDLAIGIERGYIEPDATPALIGDVPLVFAGIRGRVLLDVQLWRENGKPRAVCEPVPLAASKTVPGGGGDPQVKDVILEHRRSVKEQGVREAMASRTPTANGHSFVGNATCAACHPTAAAAWNKSAHAHAWQTLVTAEQDPKRYGWPVTNYPDCVSCHVVGYGQKTGFVSPEQTPQLENVGCEQCHGAGSAHVQSAGAQPLGLIRSKAGETASMLCTTCHDYEQSPQFVYKERWALIEHGREPK